MTEMFGEAWSPMSVPDLAPDDDDDITSCKHKSKIFFTHTIDIKFSNVILYNSADPPICEATM